MVRGNREPRNEQSGKPSRMRDELVVVMPLRVDHFLASLRRKELEVECEGLMANFHRQGFNRPKFPLQSLLLAERGRVTGKLIQAFMSDVQCIDNDGLCRIAP